jgi:hypothetical protein
MILLFQYRHNRVLSTFVGTTTIFEKILLQLSVHRAQVGNRPTRRKFDSHLRMSLSPTQRRRDGELGGGVLTDDEKIDKIFPNIGNNGNK